MEVVVELPDGQMAWMSADDVRDVVKAPKPPKPWGTHRVTDLLTDVVPTRMGRLDEVERDGARRGIRFTPRHVRPGETVPLPAVYLTVPASKRARRSWCDGA